MEIELEMNKKDLRGDKIYVNTPILQSHSDHIRKIKIIDWNKNLDRGHLVYIYNISKVYPSGKQSLVSSK